MTQAKAKTTPKIPDFEGETVSGTRLKITGAATGLNKGLKVLPEVHHRNERTYYLLALDVTRVAHEGDSDDNVIRVHHASAIDGLRIDDELAQKLISEAAKARQEADAEARGQLLLDAEDEATDREAGD